MAGGKKSVSHTLTPEALGSPSPHSLEGSLEKAGPGLGSTAWGRGSEGTKLQRNAAVGKEVPGVTPAPIRGGEGSASC